MTSIEENIVQLTKEISSFQKKICRLKRRRNAVPNHERPKYTAEIDKLQNEVRLLMAEKKVLIAMKRRNQIAMQVKGELTCV